MNRREILDAILAPGIVPVIRTERPDAALHAAEALMRGGMRAVEITMTVPGALGLIESLATRCGSSVLVGAGTVLDAETARSCILAGAQFLVTPSLNLATIELARRYSKPIFPGALTPTEVLAAWQAGADAVKIFPCNAVGGPKYIRMLKGPFPDIEMIPSGGINLENTPEYLKAGACAVAAGGELVDAQSIEAQRFDLIETRTRQYLEAAASAGLANTRSVVSAV